MRKKIEKRISRSETILDFDDCIILLELSSGVFSELEDLKKRLNISHKGLLTHLRRLSKHKLITIGRSTEDYKFKIVGITPIGKEVLRQLLKSPDIESKLRQKEV